MEFWIQWQKMKDNELLAHINASTVGVLWLNSTPLSVDSSYMIELDYLCDGVITQRINMQGEQRDDEESLHTFFTTNFGKPLFVMHVYRQEGDTLWKQIKKCLDICLQSEKDASSNMVLLADEAVDLKYYSQKIQSRWENLDTFELSMKKSNQ